VNAQLEMAVAALSRGGVVVVPTDTVYGIAVRATDRAAVARMYELKARPEGVPIAVLVADTEQAASIGRFSGADRAVADALWPGPLTLVVPATVELSFTPDDGTVGIRCPDADLVRAIAHAVGPLAVTSANAHGAPTPTTATDAAMSLAGEVDLIVDDGPRDGVPSTVATIGPPLVIHRQGDVTPRALTAVLDGRD